MEACVAFQANGDYITDAYATTDHFQLPLPIWMPQQSHCPPSLIAVDTGNLI